MFTSNLLGSVVEVAGTEGHSVADRIDLDVFADIYKVPVEQVIFGLDHIVLEGLDVHDKG